VFKLKKLYQLLAPTLTFIQLGGGSSTSSPTLTPEQTALLKAQTDAYTSTFLPAYQNTVGGAQNVYGQSLGNFNNNMANTTNQALSSQAQANTIGGAAAGFGSNWGNFATGLGAGSSQGAGGAANVLGGLGLSSAQFGGTSLANLFSPQYEKEQVKASLVPAMEAAREASGGQTAMFGGAGGAGSSREALANANLNSLNQQRMQSAAAVTQGQIENQRQSAATTLYNTGMGGLNQAGNIFGGLANTSVGMGNAATNAGNLSLGAFQQGLNNAGTGLTTAGAPLSNYAQLASIIFGTPSSATPNFTGTQGTNTSGSGFKVGY
jgi:hypothetical protein